jgi:hypothetical protein
MPNERLVNAIAGEHMPVDGLQMFVTCYPRLPYDQRGCGKIELQAG